MLYALFFRARQDDRLQTVAVPLVGHYLSLACALLKIALYAQGKYRQWLLLPPINSSAASIPKQQH
jgi:hypothetical protein